MTKRFIDDLSYNIIGAAIEVHKIIGAGLLESVYHKCMMRELSVRKIKYVTELNVPIEYKGIEIETNLRCDLLIENCIAVELKSVDFLVPVFEAQILTYMRLLNSPKGILLNFNCVNIFKEGQKTYVNELYKNLPNE